MNAVLPVGIPIPPKRVVSRHTARPCWEVMPNEFDSDLLCEHQMWVEIVNQGGLQKICCPQGRPKYANRPWIAMPSEGRRFKPIGVLNVPDLSDPTNLNVPFTVLTMIVPLGYRSVITDVVCNISNSTFVEGSGDLVWRLSASDRYLRDMGNVITQLGSLTSPNPVPRGGLLAYSYNVLKWTVTFGTNAPLTINPAGKVICSFTGWNWPM